MVKLSSSRTHIDSAFAVHHTDVLIEHPCEQTTGGHMTISLESSVPSCGTAIAKLTAH